MSLSVGLLTVQLGHSNFHWKKNNLPLLNPALRWRIFYGLSAKILKVTRAAPALADELLLLLLANGKTEYLKPHVFLAHLVTVERIGLSLKLGGRNWSLALGSSSSDLSPAISLGESPPLPSEDSLPEPSSEPEPEPS